ncbi:hypothetical protein RB653_004282 [Dictyostelium firmibasis]|uniref:Non-structural maintenance of chromosomes element 1 homolog n=1 Tax=Dictyostelium firmibasis TaxID=79012 RepID=A0AAN7YZY2_9MYCE
MRRSQQSSQSQRPQPPSQPNRNRYEPTEDEEIEYDRQHRLLLDQFTKRRVITTSTLNKLISTINRITEVNISLDNYINSLNSRIIEVGLQIKSLNTDGTNDYILTNLIPDECARFATLYNGDELKFFKLILKLFVETRVGLKKNDILTLGREDLKMKLADADNMLRKFMEDGWLRLSVSKSFTTLSNRGLLDMEPLLEGIPSCTLCHSICVLLEDESVQCPNEDCAVMHSHCAEGWFKANKNKCPTCSTRMDL